MHTPKKFGLLVTPLPSDPLSGLLRLRPDPSHTDAAVPAPLIYELRVLARVRDSGWKRGRSMHGAWWKVADRSLSPTPIHPFNSSRRTGRGMTEGAGSRRIERKERSKEEDSERWLSVNVRGRKRRKERGGGENAKDESKQCVSTERPSQAAQRVNPKARQQD